MGAFSRPALLRRVGELDPNSALSMSAFVRPPQTAEAESITSSPSPTKVPEGEDSPPRPLPNLNVEIAAGLQTVQGALACKHMHELPLSLPAPSHMLGAFGRASSSSMPFSFHAWLESGQASCPSMHALPAWGAIMLHHCQMHGQSACAHLWSLPCMAPSAPLPHLWQLRQSVLLLLSLMHGVSPFMQAC